MIPLSRTAPRVELKRRITDQPFYCVIRIEGALDPKWLSWFEGFYLSIECDQTVLTGWMPGWP